MTQTPPKPDSAPADAATLMVLRNGTDGLEVFMTRRAPSMAFAPNAMVFPGGKVDASDHMNAGDNPLRAFENAVLRETFEEVGLLLARKNGQAIAPDAWQKMAPLRVKIARREMSFQHCLTDQDLVLDYGALSYVSRWITPPKFPKRYDTRFFIAELPRGQALHHDGSEAVASEWLRPQHLLARAAKGEAVLLPPTYWMLKDLTRFSTVESAKAEMETAQFEPDLRNKQA